MSDENKDVISSLKNTTELTPLSDIVLFNKETPFLGFVLPEGSDESIIQKIMDSYDLKENKIKPKKIKSEDDMLKFKSGPNNTEHLLGAIVFQNKDLLKYAIRLDISNTENPKASPVQNIADIELISQTYSHYLEVFCPLQSAVDQAIIRLKTKDENFSIKYFIGELGRMASKLNHTAVDIIGNLAYSITLAFMANVYIITLNLVKEKEDNLKDGLLITGVHPTVFWLSWYVLEGFIAFVVSIVMVVIINFSKILINVNPFIIFVVIFLFSLSACSLGFIFSTFFKKSKTAGVVVLIFYFVFCFISMFTPYINENILKILSFIFSSITLSNILSSIEKVKYTYKSITLFNIFNINVGLYICILVFNDIIYCLIAVVFDNLFSGENSRYLFMPKRKIKNLHSENELSYKKDIQDDFTAKHNEKSMVEVSHVHKIFKMNKKNVRGVCTNSDHNNSEFLAVNDVSFKVYENEIFAILGHNGAGKTTLINIMVGLMKTSYGDIYFDGSSITKDLNKIRKDFGVCAQTNIIYKDLTVEDHIKFFADLKNVKVDVDEALQELDLLPQKKVKASKLSGGQKRKLCIGMATIGNPKYLFLDEPTTGLDPLSRHRIWELLLKKREGRVIFLTTHYMDEADILADRKLILNKGKIRCLGTSLYLKNHFNMKYSLDVETNEKEKINEIVMHYIPEANYVENNESNEFETHIKFYTWRLPLNSSDRFAPLLNELDRLTGSMINKYALSLPTLEELFIRLEDGVAFEGDENTVINDDDKLLIKINQDRLPRLSQVSKPNSLKLSAILVKYRLKIFLKDKAFAFSAIILPIILLALTFYFINTFMFEERVIEFEATEITVPSMYVDTKINYASNATLPLTIENIVTGVGNQIYSVSNVQVEEMPFPTYEDNYYLASVGGEKDNFSNTLKFDIFYNDTMPHSVPAIFNALSNAYLASRNINDRITVVNHPFDEKQDGMATIGLMFVGLMLGMSIVSILNKFGPLSARERISQLLLQLRLNGISRFIYWIACLITDNSIFLMTCILIILAGVAVGFEPLKDMKFILIIIVLLIIWSIPTMLFQYILSFLFKKEETAYNGINSFNTYPILIGYIGLIIINSRTSDPLSSLKGELYGNVTILFCLVLTAVCPAFGIVAFLNALFTMKTYSILLSTELTFKTIMKFKNMITPLLILFIILIFVYYKILMALDRKKNQTRKRDVYEIPPITLQSYENDLNEGDDDVKREYEYVQEHQKELPISILHLCKEFIVLKKKISDKDERHNIEKKNSNDYTYGDIHKSVVNPSKFVKTAVIDVNFGVRTHECFGLLGPNGAGKSTILNIVTATMSQTMGSICYNGVETHEAKLGEVSMGYCPQHDILWKELTLREHIEFFLRIRGYNSNEAKEYATQYINVSGLEEHQNKRVDNLSGGTKRKLSILIAICGYPERILLDEPTAGMDPSTRRLIWDIIKQTKRMNDSALIMTTHSMEEAEKLCDRLAILVNGRLNCIGSPEHLKMKFGEDYILEIQSDFIDQFHTEIVERGHLFGSYTYELDNTYINRAKYEVNMTKNLGSVFEKMEECKKRGLVSDYSFNQTSLEQIFIKLAKKQIVPMQ